MHYFFRSDQSNIDISELNKFSTMLDRNLSPIVFFFTTKGITDFVSVGIHTKPSDATAEVSNLADVYDHVVANLNVKDVIFMGDFNAACKYVKSFNDVDLATDPRFYWLTTDAMDTTTSKTDCAYDRFVVAGDNMLKGVVPGSSGVFHFDEMYHLNTEQVCDSGL